MRDKDIIQRLRWPPIHGSEDHPISVKLRIEAADEIVRLRHQIQDAEIALNSWDNGRNSEYWLRHQKDAANAR